MLRSLEKHTNTTIRNSRPIIFPMVLRTRCFLSLAAICQSTGSRRRSGSRSSPVEKSISKNRRSSTSHTVAPAAIRPTSGCVFIEDPLRRMKFKVRKEEEGRCRVLGGRVGLRKTWPKGRRDGGGPAGWRDSSVRWRHGHLFVLLFWARLGASLTRPSSYGRNHGLMRSLTRVPLIPLSLVGGCGRVSFPPAR